MATNTGKPSRRLAFAVIAGWLGLTALVMGWLNPITVIDLIALCTAPRFK